MKIRTDDFHLAAGNLPGQGCVQRPGQLPSAVRPLKVEGDYLTDSMNPAVRARRPEDVLCPPSQVAKGRFDLALHGPLPALILKTLE
jgi:hypothetical protein